MKRGFPKIDPESEVNQAFTRAQWDAWSCLRGHQIQIVHSRSISLDMRTEVEDALKDIEKHIGSGILAYDDVLAFLEPHGIMTGAMERMRWVADLIARGIVKDPRP